METYAIYILLSFSLFILIGLPVGIYCCNCWNCNKNNDKKYILENSLLVNQI